MVIFEATFCLFRQSATFYLSHLKYVSSKHLLNRYLEQLFRITGQWPKLSKRIAEQSLFTFGPSFLILLASIDSLPCLVTAEGSLPALASRLAKVIFNSTKWTSAFLYLHYNIQVMAVNIMMRWKNIRWCLFIDLILLQ